MLLLFLCTISSEIKCDNVHFMQIMEVSNNNTFTAACFREKFESTLIEYEKLHQGSQRKPWTFEKVLEVMNHIRKARATTSTNQAKTAMDYYWLSKYDIMKIEDKEILIFKKKSPNDPTVRIIPRNEYFDILEEVHKLSGHGGRDKMTHAIKSNYYIPKKAIEIFLAYCPTCETKKYLPKKNKVAVCNPTVSQDLDVRAQVDLIDFQSCPDGEYRWLLNYQDVTTKFLSLRPLKSNRPQEIATELLKLFMTFGAPDIVQSEDGREFTAMIMEELTGIWPTCKIVLGSPEPQGNVNKSTQVVENMLKSWMYENSTTTWAFGCYQVQYKINTSVHCLIGKSPYKAMFGNEPKTDMSSFGTPSIFTEDDKDTKISVPVKVERDTIPSVFMEKEKNRTSSGLVEEKTYLSNCSTNQASVSIKIEKV